MEFAVATLGPPVPLQIVAPPAAERAAVVRGRARPVARPSRGAGNVQGRIALAEVRGALVVEEVEGEFLFGLVGVPDEVFVLLPAALLRLQARVLWSGVPHVVLVDEDGGAVAFLQELADLPVVRCCSPTGLHFAASGHPVALALYLHAVGNYLRRDQKAWRELHQIGEQTLAQS